MAIRRINRDTTALISAARGRNGQKAGSLPNPYAQALNAAAAPSAASGGSTNAAGSFTASTAAPSAAAGAASPSAAASAAPAAAAGYKGLASDGSVYTIGSQKGIDWINNSRAGDVLTGTGDNSVWTNLGNGTVQITRDGVTYTVGAPNKTADALDAVGNYGSFSYDPATDQLYQAYRKQYIREGRRSTEDTLGQLAAASGGIPSSYAATAAAQAGNYYNAQLTDKIPELEQLAYNRWLQDYEMKNNYLNQLRTSDATAWDRNQDTLDRERLAQQDARQAALDALDKAQTAANYGDYSLLPGVGISPDLAEQAAMYGGTAADGSTYGIGSQRGIAFIESAAPGATMQGGDGSTWLKNADGSVTITRGDQVYTVQNPNAYESPLAQMAAEGVNGYNAAYLWLANEGYSDTAARDIAYAYAYGGDIGYDGLTGPAALYAAGTSGSSGGSGGYYRRSSNNNNDDDNSAPQADWVTKVQQAYGGTTLTQAQADALIAQNAGLTEDMLLAAGFTITDGTSGLPTPAEQTAYWDDAAYRRAYKGAAMNAQNGIGKKEQAEALMRNTAISNEEYLDLIERFGLEDYAS